MKSAKTIVIVASVVFLALCLGAYSAEQDDASTAKVVPTTPARGSRIPARPAPVIEEEEAPIPIPNQAARPVRVTPPRMPGRRTPTPARTTPTRPTPSRAPSRRVRPPEDPYKNSVILVEAFMVQVRLSALRSLDVPQISEGCKSVTAEHIIKLIKTMDAAVVTAGAKLALVQGNKANTKSTARESILSGPPEKKRIEYVNVGTRFTAVAEVRRDDKIFVNLEFENSAIEKGDGKTDKGVFVGRDFSSSVLLQNGKPILVGATQDKETAIFLIVTANIQE